ncbi:DUF6807 family protein [Fimbriiglobus ruber]|uniref:Methane oxygenase PmoA n=1 Tax=Fimbriiglobus ruber TaxID=1908690 RepID=A0A225E6W3_9BACT|nr:DUF6807 family protein [Fimbriiglobus ruber]OWK45239.1 hypothetical protein FRUB_01570 [Fimbriiglobus ruber]
MFRSALVTLLLAAAPALAANPTITVTGGKHDEADVVCKVKYSLPPDNTSVRLADGTELPAQMVGRAVLDPAGADQYLTFVLPKLAAERAVTLTVHGGPGLSDKGDAKRFHFQNESGKYTDLLFGSRKVLRSINAPHDATDATTHYMTFKPFHQVFDPATGETLLSSGVHPNTKEFLYPHHRGLFYGFNKVSYGNKQTADVWHGTDKVFSQYDKTLATEAGPVLGRERGAISWHGKDGKTFASEERELTAYNVPGGTLIDFASVLTTELPKVRLDGDPQHSGFHFRAPQEVAAKSAKQTYYLRPDGKGKPGETRNWDAKGKDPKTVNLPWNAMSFVVAGKRYTVLRVDHPDNPKESRGSERDYGRFGDYFEYDLTPEKPLKVKYRVWVQEGEMTKDQCEALARGFTEPPAVAAK